MMNNQNKTNFIKIFDFIFFYGAKNKVIEKIFEIVFFEKNGYVIVTDLYGFTRATKDKASYNAFKEASLIVSDSMILQRLISIKKRLSFMNKLYCNIE